MSVFIAADLNFCESEGQDNMLINNWNGIVEKDDTVILLGDIVKKEQYNWDRIKEIFSSLNGSKEIINVHKESKSREKWEEILGKRCYRVTAAVKGKINDKLHIVIIYPYSTPALEDKDYKGTDMYAAAPRSVTNQKEIFEDNVLSISINDWGMSPIPYENIPNMIDDMLLFERMETKEEKLGE